MSGVINGLLGSDDDGPERRTGEAAAEHACVHFRNIAADADILSDEEMRTKLREVNRDARASDSPLIQKYARELLGAYTRGDEQAAADAVLPLSDACASQGF